MPISYYYNHYERWLQRKKSISEKKKKHEEIVKRWKAGEITWNEYIRIEKKYRT